VKGLGHSSCSYLGSYLAMPTGTYCRSPSPVIDGPGYIVHMLDVVKSCRMVIVSLVSICILFPSLFSVYV